jgi:pyruvate/2-oxoglutarate dehydrogenase complex dihydrolipoamide dehydrogenase (E3) component
MSDHFDLIVIGSGAGGRSAAGRAASEHGARVAIVERVRWGGGCPNIACHPTKAYLVAAEFAHTANELSSWMGIETGPARVDLARVREWKRSLTRTQEKWKETLAEQGLTLFDGQAIFADARTVHVDGRELTADRIVVATGSRTAVPPIPGLDAVGWIDHIGALELTEVPESLLVVGAGPVGVEFAQIFSRFGSRVTVVNTQDRMLPRNDAEAAAELQAALEEEGIAFMLGESVESFAEGRARLTGGREVEVSQVLLASGRVANTEELALDRAGVETDRGYVVVDDRQRTTADGIWAIGDCAVGLQFTPAADYQGEIAIADMYGVERHADYRVFPIVVFTEPELAQIGLTEEEARDAGHDVEVVKQPVTWLVRASFTKSTHGLHKIVFDRATRKVLGVHVVCRGAGDIVGALAPALALGVTVDALADVHYVYPSYSEGLKEAALQAVGSR